MLVYLELGEPLFRPIDVLFASEWAIVKGVDVTSIEMLSGVEHE